MAYADYDYYQNVYQGVAIGPEDFPRLAQRACAYIDAATMDRARNAAGGRMEAVRKAVCALAEVLQDEERVMKRTFSSDRPVQSETVGPWTKNYGPSAVTGAETGLLDSRKREMLQIYLGPVGLLRMKGYRS